MLWILYSDWNDPSLYSFSSNQACVKICILLLKLHFNCQCVSSLFLISSHTLVIALMWSWILYARVFIDLLSLCLERRFKKLSVRKMNNKLYIYIYTLTGHFIMYTLLVQGWTPFCLQKCLNSLWHRFNKVLETFLRDFGPYWHDSITQLLQICQLHIHANLPFHHIPKVLYWIEIWWLWRPFEWSELIVLFKKTSLRWFELLWHGALSCWK